MLIPLIDKQLYENLSAKRLEMERAGFADLAPVFVPVGPELSHLVPVRLLFVGQATGGNLEGASDFIRSAEKSIEIVSNAPNSPFWQDIWQILERALRTVGAADLIERRDEIVGWSNLVKIGNMKHNPGEKEIAVQANLCIEALHAEIRAFRPIATILFTGHYAERDIMGPAFESANNFLDNVKDQDRVAVKNHPEFGPILWAYHPRDMRQHGYESEVVNFISGYVAALARQ